MKILYFGAEHCPQCKAMKPNFESECARLGLKEGENWDYIDAEENEEKAMQYGVRSLPTLVFVSKNGETYGKSIGVTAWKEIEPILVRVMAIEQVKGE